MAIFDLRGPQFLVVYAAIAGVLILLARLCRHFLESGAVPKFKNVDPYLIAHLRGGDPEAQRVAVLSLIDRGLITAKGDRLRANKSGAGIKSVRRPLERAILEELDTETTASDIFQSYRILAASQVLGNELKALRLVPDGHALWLRRALWLSIGAVLAWIAIAKMQIALQRGHTNVQFLVFLAVAVQLAAFFWVGKTSRTTLGNRVLKDLQTLFARLREQAHKIRPGGATNELALLAGTFGLAALQGTAATHAEACFPAARRKSNSSCGTTSCGFSSGSSCGSSCGGGGGCGGCGGCGS
jgi:uncharacterized protein (TIGR04222 family)